MTELVILGNTTPYQMFGAVLFTENHTVVIDGGLEEDAPQLRSLLADFGRTKISAWLISHPHHDHLGAFMAFAREGWGMELEKLLLHFPSRETLRLCPAHKAHGGVERQMWEDVWDLLEGRFFSRYEKIEAGDTFRFDEATLSVLRVMDPALDVKKNFVNNSSAVFRLDTQKKRVLFLGDLGVDGGKGFLPEVDPEELFAHYTVMAHHGQKGVDFDFYRAVRPQFCIWPTPEKIWDNVGEEGPGTGKWDTALTRKWMEELGVKEHFVTKDGCLTLRLE